MGTWPGWDTEVLVNIGAPVTSQNLLLLDSWQACEGGLAAFNPLNTTQPEPGATDYNSVGVKNYPTWRVGLKATVTALENGRYDGIIGDLRAGGFTALHIVQRNAAEFSVWGTSTACLLSKLGSSPTPPPVPPGVIGGPKPPSANHVPAAWKVLTHALGHDLGGALYRSRRIRLRVYRALR